VELTDGRTCLDDTAETTQNYKEKEEDLKNDPDDNRIFKGSTEVEKRKYIVDIAGDLPVILMELNNSGCIVKRPRFSCGGLKNIWLTIAPLKSIRCEQSSISGT
jgi:hypothetical protein